MEQLLGILLLCCIILIVILWVIERKKQDKLNYAEIELKLLKNLKKCDLKEYFREEWNEEEKRIDLKKKTLLQEYEQNKREIDLKLHNLETILEEKEKRYEEVNQDLDLYKEGKLKEIDKSIEHHEKTRRAAMDSGFKNYKLSLEEQSGQIIAKLQKEEDAMREEISHIKAELEVERSKRAAINEEIKRAKEVEMKQDFYRIQLDPNDKNDIEILRSITPRLRHPEAINKIIWNGYYQKPLAELRKRAGVEGSGVYKITRLKTNEVYIGQAKKISDRWMQHCKSALGVGTLASSQLHRVMAEDGPEQFLWEVLEEVEPDKLRERESYYIDFYDSKTYGLNTISGDKNK